MTNRIHTSQNEFHLDNKEQYILNEKFKLSGMKSKSVFLRKLILYGYVYDVDYSFPREYNTELGRINSSLNQIAKRINSTNHVYQEDMDEVKELMKQVWHTQKSMLSQQPLIKRSLHMQPGQDGRRHLYFFLIPMRRKPQQLTSNTP